MASELTWHQRLSLRRLAFINARKEGSKISYRLFCCAR